MCSFWGSRTWKRLGAPEPPHVRIFVWNFPSCPRQLFHILSACLLSGFIQDDEGPRCSAMRCSSNPPLFFFFDTWQIINGGLAALRRSSEWTHQIRCLTGQVHTDKNLHFACFLWGCSIIRLGCGFGFKQNFFFFFLHVLVIFV